MMPDAVFLICPPFKDSSGAKGIVIPKQAHVRHYCADMQACPPVIMIHRNGPAVNILLSHFICFFVRFFSGRQRESCPSCC